MKFSVFEFKNMAKGIVKTNTATTFLTMLIVAVMSESLTLLQQAVFGTAEATLANQMLSMGLSVITLLIVAPANFGAANVFCDMVQNSSEKPAKPSTVFSWYGEMPKLLKCMGLSIMQALIMCGWVIVFGGIIVGVIALVSSQFLAGMQSTDPNVMATTVMIMYFAIIIAMALAYVMFCVYMPSTYILAANPKKSIRACLKQSKQIIKPVRFRLLKLHGAFLLQLFGVSMLASIAATFVSGADPMAAVNIAMVITMLASFFYISPQFHVSTILFLNDATVGSIAEGEGEGTDQAEGKQD